MRIPALLLLAAAVCFAAPPKRAGYLGARLGADPAGVRLVQVFPNSPAAEAGLVDGDVVVRFDGAAVGSAAELGGKLREAGEGASVEVVVMRDGAEKTLTLTLGIHPRVALEQPDTSPGMKPVAVSRDVSYFLGEGEPHERHLLNLFLPKVEGKFPIVLWIHAGAWSYGGRTTETALATRFAERGIGFAPMSYRLSSRFWNDPSAPKEGFRHPAHAEDCAMAFAWLRKRFPGHPLFVSGHSCGAQLAALIAMDPRYLKKHGLGVDAVAGVVALGGGYDLVRYHDILANGIGGQPGLGQEKADAHLKWIFGDTKDDWIAASPTTYLEGCKVPMLIVAETEPSMVQYTKDFEEAVKAAGVESIRFLYTKDRTHGQTTAMMSLKAADHVRASMIEFVRDHAE
jgi:acetyl esterase/lipase